MKTPGEKALKKFRELIRKQDKSACISFVPKQLFFGNHEMPVLPSSPFTICPKSKNRNQLFLRMIVAKDAAVGYHEMNINVVFSNFEQIRLIDGHAAVQPVIAFTLTPEGFQRVIKHFPGLKDKVEKSTPGSSDSRVMMFILKVIRSPEKSGYMTYTFNDNGVSISRVIDFKEAKIVLMEDIAAVDKQHHAEKVTQFKGGFSIYRDELFKEVDPTSFSENLRGRNIGEVRNVHKEIVLRAGKNPRYKPYAPVNSEEYAKKRAPGFRFTKPNPQFVKESTHIGKAVRERRMDGNLAMNLHWVDRECYVFSDVDYAQENQHPAAGGPDGIYNFFVNQGNYENGSLLFQQKSIDEMECEPAVQSSNGGQHSSSFYSIRGDVPEVTREMSQMKMSYQAWNTGEHGFVGLQAYQQHNMLPYRNPMNQGDFHLRPRSDETESHSPSPPMDINAKLGRFNKVEFFAKDLKTLDRREFINDNVIEFMCEHFQSEMSEELRQKCHFFGTFFYTRLTSHGTLPSLCFSQRRPITPENEALLTVAPAVRWTKDVDMFGKDYIIVPINEDLHWVVLVIINPSGAVVNKRREKTSRRAPKAKILFFDPLSGLDPSRCNHMCFIIKKWLKGVYDAYNVPGKKFSLGENMYFDESRIDIIKPKNIPIQNNFADCGLYVIHYIEGLFRSPAGPIRLKDLPTLDWAEKWPQAEKMCELMRDKAYYLMVNFCDEEGRSRLAQFERVNRCGLSRERATKKYRRHSAVPFRYTRRHPEYYARHYSVNPPAKNVITEDPMFANPRGMALMPITQRVRSLRLPEENFPIAY